MCEQHENKTKEAGPRVPTDTRTATPSAAGTSVTRAVVALVGWIVICLGAGLPGAIFKPGAWYAALAKPPWTPPDWVFAPVWTMLYCLMACAAWLVSLRGGFTNHRRALGLFLLQLLLNAAWTPLFFGLRSPGIAFAELILLLGVVTGTVVWFRRIHPVAGWLLIPYLAWLVFAAALNYSVWQLNR